MPSLHRLSAVVVLVISLGVAASGAAKAGDCDAPAGKTIFDDTFKDDGGGFMVDEQAKFGAPGLHLTLGKTEDGWPFVTDKVDMADGDYCAVATMPAPAAADNLAAVGLTLFYIDEENMIAVYVFSDNTVQVERRSKGDSELVLNEQNPAVKAGVGSTVSIRALVRDGSITPFINGFAFKATRALAPSGASKFGLYVGLDKVANKDVAFDFKRLRVTTLAEAKK